MKGKKIHKIAEQSVAYGTSNQKRPASPVGKQVSSFRLDSDLKKPVDEWLARNPGINFSRLVNVAVFTFITQPHVLQPVTIEAASSEDVLQSLQKMMEEHAITLEQLK